MPSPLGPEDIIDLKIQAYSNNRKRAFQDKVDIEALIEKYDKLDWDRIKFYTDQFGEWGVIEKIKQSRDL